MAKVIFGNHAAVRVSLEKRECIWKFYCDVLGGEITRTFDGKDDICLSGNFFIDVMYRTGLVENLTK